MLENNSSFDMTGSPACSTLKDPPITDDYNCLGLSADRPRPSSDFLSYAVVRWYNPRRGFGFVELSHGSGDAFLHRRALVQSDISAVDPGAVLRVRIDRADKGLQVIEVLSVDNSTAVPALQDCRKTRSSEDSFKEPGTVRWFDAKRGYGFIVCDHGSGEDVFVHVSTLKEALIRSLSRGQRVIVHVIEGRRGPQARWIRLA